MSHAVAILDSFTTLFAVYFCYIVKLLSRYLVLLNTQQRLSDTQEVNRLCNTEERCNDNHTTQTSFEERRDAFVLQCFSKIESF